MQGLSDNVALHKADIDDIRGMAQKLAASCSVEMVATETSQLAGRYQALTSNVQVSASINFCNSSSWHTLLLAVLHKIMPF